MSLESLMLSGSDHDASLPIAVARSPQSVLLQRHSLGKRASYWFCSLMIHTVALFVIVFVLGSVSRGRGSGTGGDRLSVTFHRGDGSAGTSLSDNSLPADPDWYEETPGSADQTPRSSKFAVSVNFKLSDPQSLFSDEPTEIAPSELLSEAALPRTLLEKEGGTSTSSGRSRSTNTTPFAEAQGRATQRDAGASLGHASGNSLGDSTLFFGITARAKRFVYVIDASDSMLEHKALETAREELWLSLQELAPPTLFQVVFFNLEAHAMAPRGAKLELLLATPANLRRAQQFVAAAQTDSGTDRFQALLCALRFNPDAIFLLTDADDPALSASDLDKLRRANRSQAKIHTVEIGRGIDLATDNFLRRLARQHGGEHRYFNLTPTDAAVPE